MRKFFYVKRLKDGKDLGTVDIPEEHLAETLKRNPQWVNLGEAGVSAAPVKQVAFACPLCDKTFENEAKRQEHKADHYD